MDSRERWRQELPALRPVLRALTESVLRPAPSLHAPRLHGLPQPLRPVEDPQQAPVRAQPTTLQIREQVLTDGRILRRPLPKPECVLLAIGGDPQGHDEAVIADVHPIQQQAHQVQGVERRRLPGLELRRRLGDKAPTDRALARAAALHAGRHRLQAARVLPRGHAHHQLLEDPPIQRVGVRQCAEGRQLDLAALRPHPRPTHRHLAAAEDDLAGHRARSRGYAVWLMRIPRATDGRAILFQHRIEHLQARPDRQLEELRAGVDEQIHQREMALR